MGNRRQVLTVDLSGEQKNVLGFASWTQVSISAIGIILGVLIFVLAKSMFSLAGTAVSIGIAAVLFGIVLAPFIYIAFVPIRDKQGNLLYYKYKQLLIDYQYKRTELGTYVNIQSNHYPVNRRFIR